MKQQILHTPEGVRDIYGIEYRRKLVLEEALQNALHLYGYQDIQTPMFEYLSVFGKEIGTIPSKELYQFFDREGNTLALRPDITPSIARAVASCLEEQGFPLRLCYSGPTFINHSSYQGRMKESTQLGAELLGVSSLEADAEMIALAVECLSSAGLKEFQISVGHVAFFESLMEEAHLPSEAESKLRELIENRNYFGVEELLDNCNANEKTKKAFQALECLTGGMEVLKLASEIVNSPVALEAVDQLREIYHLLCIYGVERYITFDFSMSGTYRYYTGMIFRGYTYGSGDAIVKGGRYDHLVEKFGKELPSIGFAIVTDELLNAFGRQKIEIPYEMDHTLILYDIGRKEQAIVFGRRLRIDGNQTELVRKEKGKTLEDYFAYGNRTFCNRLYYLKDDGTCQRVNLLTNERTFIEWEENA